jgi:hypothetical protein
MFFVSIQGFSPMDPRMDLDNATVVTMSTFLPIFGLPNLWHGIYTVLEYTTYIYWIFYPKINNNSRTSKSFKREIKIKSTIPKLINFEYLRGTVRDGGRVAGCDHHEVALADGRTPRERRCRRPAASGSRCSYPPLAVEVPLHRACSPPSLVLAAPFVGGPSTGRWEDPQREKRTTPRAIRFQMLQSTARHRATRPSRPLSAIPRAIAPFAGGPCVDKWEDPQW